MAESFPTPTKRRRMDIDENDEDFHAQVKTHLEQKKSGQSKAAKRFASKVLKVVEGEKVQGVYTSSYMITLSSKTKDLWTMFEQGDQQQITSFFQPLQFKDAEAILFFNKSCLNTSFANVAIGWNNQTGNNDKLSTVRVIDSSVHFSFKSNSSMRMIVELYEIQGDKNLSTVTVSQKWADVWAAYAINTFHLGGAAGTGVIQAPVPTALHVSLGMVPQLLDDYKVKRTVFKFNPGEEAEYQIKGPKNYEMKSANKITGIGTDWNNWTFPGSGIRVMFRVISDINMAFYTGAAPGTSTQNANLSNNAFNIGHYANTNDNVSGVGSVNCEVTMRYKIDQPEGTTAAGLNFEPACVIYNDYATMTAGANLVIQTVVPGSGTAGADPPKD